MQIGLDEPDGLPQFYIKDASPATRKLLAFVNRFRLAFMIGMCLNCVAIPFVISEVWSNFGLRSIGLAILWFVLHFIFVVGTNLHIGDMPESKAWDRFFG